MSKMPYILLGGAVVTLGMYCYLQAQRMIVCPKLTEADLQGRKLLLMTLEELKIQYQVVYMHYHRVIGVVSRSEQQGGPDLDQLVHKLQQQSESILAERVEKVVKEGFNPVIQNLSDLRDQINLFLTNNDVEIRYQVGLFDINQRMVFSPFESQEPDFELKGELLEKEQIVQMVGKVYAGIRHSVYKRVREIVRSKAPGESPFLSQEQMKEILSQLDTQKIRTQVYELFGLPEPSPVNRMHVVVLKQFVKGMADPQFINEVVIIQKGQDKCMKAILGSDVIPGLENENPVEVEESKFDAIPIHYRPKSNKIDCFPISIKADPTSYEGLVLHLEAQILEKIFKALDTLTPLLFSETRIKAA